MKAVVFAGKGGPEVASLQEIPTPAPQRGEVLVRLRAAALNLADLLQRRGLHPPPGFREDVPGLEFAGEMAALGEGVLGWNVADRVMAIARNDSFGKIVLEFWPRKGRRRGVPRPRRTGGGPSRDRVQWRAP
jgi:NADPH:quinone reductase-like Zn-dependent oxidoreductase